MLKSYLKHSAILVCIVGFALSSCKKNADVEPDPAPATNPNLTETFASTSAATLLSGSGMMLGVNGHMGDAPYLATPAAKQMQMIKGMGMNWYRLNVQTKADGSMSASSTFEALKQAGLSSGVNILPMLYLRTLSFSKSESENYKLGKTLGGNFAAKYGKYLTYYNLGNDLELDLLYANKTGQSQEHYDRRKVNITAAYLKGMDEGIKAKDPGAKTMISAGWLHYGFLRMCEWYGVKYDIVGYNWYSDMENAAPHSPTNIPDISLKLSSLFPKKPIWFTECNFRYKTSNSTAANESAQKDFMLKFVTKVKKNPQVKVVMIYQLFDEPYKSWQEARYGIVKWSTPYSVWTKKLLANALVL